MFENLIIRIDKNSAIIREQAGGTLSRSLLQDTNVRNKPEPNIKIYENEKRTKMILANVIAIATNKSVLQFSN